MAVGAGAGALALSDVPQALSSVAATSNEMMMRRIVNLRYE
jgi:hypothetical protein